MFFEEVDDGEYMSRAIVRQWNIILGRWLLSGWNVRQLPGEAAV